MIPATVLEFLEVVEEEAYANIMGCIDSVVGVILMLIFAPHVDKLSVLGLIFIINESVFLALNIAIPKMAGWIEPYEHGLFGKLSLKNRAIVRRLWKTALPLSVGSFLASFEWELLTIFAAVLGPAEAVRGPNIDDHLVFTFHPALTQAPSTFIYHISNRQRGRSLVSAYSTFFVTTTILLCHCIHHANYLCSFDIFLKGMCGAFLSRQLKL